MKKQKQSFQKQYELHQHEVHVPKIYCLCRVGNCFGIGSLRQQRKRARRLIGFGLGDAEAEVHYCLSFNYRTDAVLRDMAKKLQHLEQATIDGHPKARHNGVYEMNRERIERAVKHFTIATNNESTRRASCSGTRQPKPRRL